MAMAVSGYMVHDGGEALLVDTAYNAPAMIESLLQSHTSPAGICLTHGHADHADGIDQLLDFGKFRSIWERRMSALLSWRPRRIS